MKIVFMLDFYFLWSFHSNAINAKHIYMRRKCECERGFWNAIPAFYKIKIIYLIYKYVKHYDLLYTTLFGIFIGN